MKPKGKKNLSDKISRRGARNQAPAAAAKKNPFELYLTKAKHNIAGRQISSAAVPALDKLKHKNKPGQQKQATEIRTDGIRSVARSAAFQTRKKTLLKEYKTHTKNNRLVDRRLGEKDASMSLEDKMLERTMFERKKSAKSKKGLFNLNDDVDIDDSGFGQTLADVERLEEADEEEKPVDDDMDEVLGEKFVNEHHFGGGLLTKKVANPAEGAGEKSRTTFSKEEREQLLGDLIAESKQKRFEKQTELDEVRDLTKSLDDKWRDVQMRKLISSSFGNAVPEPPVESFDSLVKMLQFEGKAKGSDKLKSDAELAKEAKERLVKAERKRLKAENHDHRDESALEKPDMGAREDGLSQGLEMLEPAFDEVLDEEEDTHSEESDDDKDSTVEKPGEPEIAEMPHIPFVIPVPENRKALDRLLCDHPPPEILVIVSRIMKYHHLSLAEDNRAKLTKFFKLLFDFLLKQADDEPGLSLENWTLLTPSLYELFLISKESGAELLKLRLEVLSKLICRKARFVATASALLFLKFLAVCYKLDQHYLPMVSALNLVVGKLLVKASFADAKSYFRGLFVATIATESSKSSTRYFPELIGYLHRCLMEVHCTLTAFPPMEGEISKWSLRDMFDMENGTKPNEVQLVHVLRMCLAFLQVLIEVYSTLPAYAEVFVDCFNVIGKLESKPGFHPQMTAAVEALRLRFKEHQKPIQYLTFFKKKPAPLKMLEPRIDDKFDRTKSAKKAAVKRLQHDKKRATKGAKRELRRDNQFIARVQLEEQMKKDAARVRKVKEIYSGLYSQQSEHKALQRQKAKKKF